MKKLSDYKEEQAIELWADILDYFVEIVGDPHIAMMLRQKKAPLKTAQVILKRYPEPCSKLLLRIDPTPLDGLNIIVRLVSVLKEVGEDKDIQSFFPSLADAQKKLETNSGSAMENTEESQDTSSNT